jgi:pimeloyl-ACP methyl ester carboxylesterase
MKLATIVRNSVLLFSGGLAAGHLEGREGNNIHMSQHVFYRTVKVDGLSIFYREAGPKDAPTILLLHGLPSSSRMFEPLFGRLSDRYHLVAPDYPGFGHSDWPDPKSFAYTFDHYAEIVNHFTEALGLSRYTLYMQDYGGPVGFRMALAHPERVVALVVQDAVAHNEGLGELEGAPGFLGRSSCQRKRTSHQSSVLADHADTPHRQRPERGSLRPRSMDGRVCVPESAGPG